MDRPQPPHETDEAAVRFEHSDVEPRVVARFAVGLGALTVVTAAVAIWLLVWLRHGEERADPQRPSLFFAQEHREPAGVRLQTAPFTDLYALREEEGKILSTYGWVDQAGGVVHIPIEEAMRLYVARQATAAGTGITGADERVPTDSAPVPAAAPSPEAGAPPADAGPQR